MHDYPLFQRAYVELGYPKAYFNDRLIAVIDHLLAAPSPAQPPVVAQGKHGTFVFVDPSLEALSVGQKAMVRMGQADEAAVKSKLQDIRALLVKSGPPVAAASARSAATTGH